MIESLVLFQALFDSFSKPQLEVEDSVYIIHIPSFYEKLIALPNVLNQEEIARAERFVVEHAKQEFLTARITLKYLLASILGIEPMAITFKTNDYKKPFLSFTHQQAINFNVSHTRDWVAILISREKNVGIDIQYHQLKTDFLKIAKRFFYGDEYELLLKASPNQKKHFFYRMWAAKEAIIKAIGTGMYYPLDHVNVSACVDQDFLPIQLCEKCSEHINSSWYLSSLSMSDDISLFWTSGANLKAFCVEKLGFS